MPTVARYPRACVICERYPASAAPERACCPASAAPERDLRQHADLAGVRRELRAGDAAAPCRPGRRAMRAARRSCAAPLRPGLLRSPPARRNRRRLRSFRPCLKIPRPRAWAPTVRKRTLRHPFASAQAHAPVSGLRPCPTGCPLGPAPAACAGGRGPAAPRAGCWRGPITRAAPGNPPRSGAPAAGAGCFGVGAHCWRTLRAAPSRFAR